MSFLDDINIMREHIPWFHATIGQDTWKRMNYAEKVKLLMHDMIIHAHQIGYIDLDLKEIWIRSLQTKVILFDADKRSLLNYIVGTYLNEAYTLICFIGGNSFELNHNYPDRTIVGGNYAANELVKYENGKYYIGASAYSRHEMILHLAFVVTTTNIDKFLYRLLINYYILASDDHFKNASDVERKEIVEYTVKSLLSEQHRYGSVFYWKNRTKYPVWFVPPSENPDTWYEAVEQVNDQLLELLLSKESKANREKIATNVKKLLSTGHYVLSQYVHSLLPYFMYLKTGKGVLAIEIKDGNIMLSGYRPDRLHRVYTEYLPWKEYDSSDIIWNRDVFDELLNFYVSERS